MTLFLAKGGVIMGNVNSMIIDDAQLEDVNGGIPLLLVPVALIGAYLLGYAVGTIIDSVVN
jgi:lactobin A/cerein 7B family class IIb bacteriocin